MNVSRAGAANLDVIQEVEYVKLEARIVYLLECLQKTAPPVVVFCERKGDVDDVHENLLLKGVEAVSIHGGKDQEERNDAIRRFKDGSKDVSSSHGRRAKGLDFPDIQHVINFDMPSEIENYVHRIGRTGRCGKTGVATTFINKTVEPSALLDLKHLLVEAKQRVPPVLQVLDEPEERGEGCAFCGGLGHTILDCPKRDKDARRLNANRRDVRAARAGRGGTGDLKLWCVALIGGFCLVGAAASPSGRPGLLDAGSLGSFGAVVRERRHPCGGRARADSRLNFLVSRERRGR